MKNTFFIEIYDTGPGYHNKSILIKFLRVSIRYSARLLGYKKTLFLLELCQSSLQYLNKSYFNYLLGLNISCIKHIISLYSIGIESSVSVKNNWSEYVLAQSKNYKSRVNARMYLSLLSRHGLYKPKFRKFDSVINQNLIKRSTDKKFYIYGPNAENSPNTKYKDYTLVLSKDIELKNSFKEKFLFSNSHTFRSSISKDSKLQSLLVNKYDKVMVNCLHSKLPSNFERAKFPIGDNISSPMALGRILYNLIHQYGRFTCVIEGFDFYLDNKMYSSYYPYRAGINSTNIEQVICDSLRTHDAVYNFLYVKELCSYLDINDSISFNQLIKMSGSKYLMKLDEVRSFDLLK